MKALLAAIKTKLQTDLTYIRNGDIYITPHENYIPQHVRPPCVGIKDNGMTRSEAAFGTIESLIKVRLVVFVALAKDEASVMGDSITSKKGTLDIIADIRDSLEYDLLSISGMINATSPGESASELFGDERESLQKQSIDFDYIKHEAM